MERLNQRVDKLRSHFSRVSLDPPPTPEKTGLKSPGDAIYNKHLCHLCKHALDYVRGVGPTSDLVTVGKCEWHGCQIFELQHNSYSLQDSVDEGCYVCTASRDTLHRNGVLKARPARDLHVIRCWFLTEPKGMLNITAFYWQLKETHVRRKSLCKPLADEKKEEIFSIPHRNDLDGFGDLRLGEHYIYRKMKPIGSSLTFGLPLGLGAKSNSDSDILFDYQPQADKMAPPLWELIAEWIRRCSARHECGHKAHTSADFFPTRLVRLQTTDTGIEARLVETGADGFIRGPYLTLSHSWGPKRFLTMTSSNIQDFFTNIPMETLRCTFRDAFTITQKLGFRFIWIDSLCIMQDSVDDWRYEASRMGDVYQGSACNIAICVDSMGSSCDLLNGHRDVEDIIPLQYADVRSGQECRCLPLKSWSQEINDISLNKRGWVLQERMLAPRVLYFGGKQVFWECAEAIACEAIPEGLPPVVVGITFKKSRVDQLNKMSDAGNYSNSSIDRPAWYAIVEAYNRPAWYAIVEAYSECGLTEEGDKLIALSGLAKEWQGTVKDEYVAGLWKGHLFPGLQWSADCTNKPMRRPTRYRAPSWSWASIEGKVSFYQGVQYELAEILEVSTQPATEDPTGEIIGGHIKLCGLLIKLDVSQDNGGLEINNHGLVCAYDSPEDWRLSEIYWIVLGCTGRYFDLQGLLIKSVGPGSGAYQRIGMVSRFERYQEVYDAFANVLNLPRKLFDEPGSQNLLDKYKSVPKSGVDDLYIGREIVERTRKYIRPFMEVITIV